ncbi:MAG: hypothetical protein Q8K75_01820 [Chlamydiales bacterium]|nr:hypothetical protein [Chlamydiales bacterium]
MESSNDYNSYINDFTPTFEPAPAENKIEESLPPLDPEPISQRPEAPVQNASAIPGSLAHSKLQAKLKAETQVLKQIDSDIAVTGGINNINSRIEIIENTVDLTTFGGQVLSGVNSLQESMDEVSNLTNFAPAVDGLAGISSGVVLTTQLASLVPKSREWAKLKNLLAEKQTELASLSKSNNLSDSFIADRTAQLNREIEGLKDKTSEMAKDTAVGLMVSGLGFSSDSLSVSGELISLVPTVAEEAGSVVSNVAGGIGLATSALMIAITARSINESRLEIANILAETDHLILKLNEPNLDPTVKSIVKLRLKALEQQYDNTSLDIVKKSASLYCAVLGTSATITMIGLTAAGAATGIAAATVTTAGIMPIVIGTGLLATGLSYAAYKNRKVIELRLQQTAKNSQNKLSLSRVKKQESAVKKEFNTISNSQMKIKNIQAIVEVKTAEIEEKIAVQNELINLLHTQKEDAKNRLPLSQKRIDQQITQAFQELKNLYIEIGKIEDEGLEKISKEVDRLGTSTHKINTSFESIYTVKNRVKTRAAEVKILEARRKIQGMSQRFARTSPDQLSDHAATLVETFQNSPDALKACKEFMSEEGFITADFEENAISHVFAYLIQGAQGKEKK